MESGAVSVAHTSANPGVRRAGTDGGSSVRAVARNERPANSYAWAGVILAVAWWIAESVIHVVIFREGSLQTQLLSDDPHEIWKRLLVGGLLVVFGLYAQHGINVRRRTEEALATSEKKYRTLIEKALNPVILFSASGTIRELNDAALSFFETDRKSLFATSFFDLASGSTSELTAAVGAGGLLGQTEVDFEVGGRQKTLLLNIVPLGVNGDDLAMFFGIGLDFTDRKKMERDLQLAHADLNQIFQTASSAMRVIDHDFTVLKVNEPFSALSGYTEDAAVGRKCYEVFAGDRCSTDQCPLYQILAGAREVEYEITKKRRDGRRVSCLLTARPFVDSDGHPVAIVESFKEITELTRIQEELRTERDKLRNILFQQYEGVCILRRDFTIEYQNAALRADLGDCLGWACYAAFRGDDQPCETCYMLEAVTRAELRRFEYEAADGRIWEHTYTPFVDADREPKVVVYRRDITEDKVSKLAAIHSEQLAAVGELAAGVAHEINNPINGILNYAQMLLNRERSSDEIDGIAARIVKESDRVATIVASLLSFARRGAPRTVVTTVDELLGESLTLVGAQLRKDGIRVELELDPSLPKVLCVPQEIQQVFLNLLNNARYALNQRFPESDENKTLRIRAGAVDGPEGRRVRVSFHDSGTGISAEHLGRIMKPFYSTKPKGAGTGLGLSISQDLVRKNAGSISIESELGRYTEVNVDLPEVVA